MIFTCTRPPTRPASEAGQVVAAGERRDSGGNGAARSGPIGPSGEWDLDDPEREYHVARIVAGSVRFRHDGRTYVVGQPSRDARLVAAEVRREAWEDSALQGALTEAEALERLRQRGLWTEDEGRELDGIGELIDDQRVAVYENRFRSELRQKARKLLRDLKSRRDFLDGKRAVLWHATREAAAAAAAARFLFGAALVLESGQPYWNRPEAAWKAPDGLLETLMASAASLRLAEPEIRELARTDPWRGLWAVREYAGRGLFGCAAVDMSDEQRALVRWTSTYDSLRDQDGAPPEEEMDDDDVVDGFLVALRRRQKSSSPTREAKGEEQFILVDNASDAARVLKMNNAAALNTIAERSSAIKQGGVVHHGELPDQRRRIRMEATAAQSARGR